MSSPAGNGNRDFAIEVDRFNESANGGACKMIRRPSEMMLAPSNHTIVSADKVQKTIGSLPCASVRNHVAAHRHLAFVER